MEFIQMCFQKVRFNSAVNQGILLGLFEIDMLKSIHLI